MSEERFDANEALDELAEIPVTTRKEMIARIEELEQEVADFQASFDLQHKAHERARKMYCDKHGHHMWPDGAKNIVWFVERYAELERALELVCGSVEDLTGGCPGHQFDGWSGCGEDECERPGFEPTDCWRKYFIEQARKENS